MGRASHIANETRIAYKISLGTTERGDHFGSIYKLLISQINISDIDFDEIIYLKTIGNEDVDVI